MFSLISFFGCDPRDKNSSEKKDHSIITVTEDQETSRVPVDIGKSVVKWKGTKMLRTGKHEGIVSFKNGYLIFAGKRITGGYFIVDMTSIYITDIPLSDPVPRRNLTTHLNSDFDTNKYPEASFKITGVDYLSERTMRIYGDLTIKEITRSTDFNAQSLPDDSLFNATLIFDRFDWKIGEDGSWLEKKLVDDEVRLEIEIYY